MSAPGQLTAAELENIDGVLLLGGGVPRALPVCARRVEACNAALIVAFGFGLVISEGGDYRTKAYQDALYASGGTDTTTNNSSHCKGQAVDVNNQRSFRNVNEALFLSICAQHGLTFPISGEPWHAVISTYAFAGGIPDAAGNFITNRKDKEMRFVIIWGILTKQEISYLYDAETGERRYLKPVEASILNLSGTPTIGVTDQDAFDKIRKVPGSIDFDGSVVPG